MHTDGKRHLTRREQGTERGIKHRATETQRQADLARDETRMEGGNPPSLKSCGGQAGFDRGKILCENRGRSNKEASEKIRENSNNEPMKPMNSRNEAYEPGADGRLAGN